MGDNLKAASRFVSQSMMSLDHMMTTDSIKPTVIIDHLADLQRGAKRMRARSIYRAAQTAVNMLHTGEPDEKVQSELVVVRTLVEQYQSGLDDVLSAGLPAPQTVANKTVARQTPVNDMIADLTVQLSQAMDLAEPNISAEPIKDDISAEMETVRESWRPSLNEAKARLEPVIDYAPEAEQRDALRRLSRLYGDAKISASKKPEPVTAVELEAMMPELTNLVLTTARHTGKTVSISFAANGVRIGSSMAKKLHLALVDMCNLFVHRSLETPDVRRKRGESGAGHVSIISSLEAGKINISTECTGRSIDMSEFNIPSWLELRRAGGEITVAREGERFCLKLIGLPAYLHGSGPSHNSAAEIDLEHAS